MCGAHLPSRIWKCGGDEVRDHGLTRVIYYNDQLCYNIMMKLISPIERELFWLEEKLRNLKPRGYHWSAVSAARRGEHPEWSMRICVRLALSPQSNSRDLLLEDS